MKAPPVNKAEFVLQVYITHTGLLVNFASNILQKTKIWSSDPWNNENHSAAESKIWLADVRPRTLADPSKEVNVRDLPRTFPPVPVFEEGNPP